MGGGRPRRGGSSSFTLIFIFIGGWKQARLSCDGAIVAELEMYRRKEVRMENRGRAGFRPVFLGDTRWSATVKGTFGTASGFGFGFRAASFFVRHAQIN